MKRALRAPHVIAFLIDFVLAGLVASLTLPEGALFFRLDLVAQTAAPFWVGLLISTVALLWLDSRLPRNDVDRTKVAPTGLLYGVLVTLGTYVIGMALWGSFVGALGPAFLGIGAVAMAAFLIGWRLAYALVFTPRQIRTTTS